MSHRESVPPEQNQDQPQADSIEAQISDPEAEPTRWEVRAFPSLRRHGRVERAPGCHYLQPRRTHARNDSHLLPRRFAPIPDRCRINCSIVCRS